MISAHTLVYSAPPRFASGRNAGLSVPAGVPSTVRQLQDTEDGQTDRKVYVGIWDLGAYVGYLPRLIGTLNAAQESFRFLEVLAAIHGGLTRQPERVVEWARARRRRLTKDELREIRQNVIFEDFSPRAQRILQGTEVNYLVGLTPNPVAFEDPDEGIYFNMFTASSGQLILVSTDELRDYARKAHRPFEVFVGWLIVAQLLMVVSKDPRLEFHEDRGCLFDYHENRSTLIDAVKKPRIEPECLNLIPADFRASALALIDALKNYLGEASRS